MNLYRVSLSLPFLCFIITITARSNKPTGDVSINCGSTATSAARNGREWLGDIRPRSSSMLQLKGLSTTSTAIHKLTSADPVPYKTARISHSQFSYAFQLNSGQKIIRLHFNPTKYRGFKGLKDLFTVEAGPFTLLGNFSASLTTEALGLNTFAKEFCLNIQENQEFNIVFSPENSQSLDNYAFINGIEIISVPASLSYFRGGSFGLQVVGKKSLVYIDNSVALEIIHRLNIKQDFVSSADYADDIFGMWGTKQEVSNTYNITWNVSIDVGFRYLIRLHFSKIGVKMVETSGLRFSGLRFIVFIDEMVAITDTDIVKERDASSRIPRYEDYMVMMNGRKQEGKRDLLIRLQSNEEFMVGYGPLKGFEILKLSNPDSSLVSPNPLPPPQDPPSQTIQTIISVLGRRNAIAAAAIAIISVVNIFVHELRESWEVSSSEEENKPSAGAERLCRRFSLAEMELATRDFSDGLVIGRGGFGKVYKGLIDKGQKPVAVKRLKLGSKQGKPEFMTEIETLSQLHHLNLVSLFGYCSERREMILVYEYMACGTLADHLYKLARKSSNCTSLSWKQRLNICIGAARGLDYLHTGHGIIHRDVKASNILLDENFVPKVSDFGLAKPKDRSKLQSHVSTKVKGTFGYYDPYYYTTGKLIRKSDTYAFGVVLLEVLCGRPAVDGGVLKDEHILTKWARDKISKGEVDQIVDSSVREEILVNSLEIFIRIAERCLDDEPKNRPTMSQVVTLLEIALEQQESKHNFVLNEVASVFNNIQPSTPDGIGPSSRVQPRMATTNMQNLTLPPPTEQASSKVVKSEPTYRRKDGRKSIIFKLSTLWPWKRVKLSNKNELLLPGMVLIKLERKDFLLLMMYIFSCVESIKVYLRRCPTEISSSLGELDFDEISAVESLQFDLAKIRVATDDFSNRNMLGMGGFGPVYRGKFSNGQDIAVKRLSKRSGQGNTEFKNEVLLLARLWHRNLVKLLGFCLEGSERLLVYEFLENLSLDRFIFDPTKQSHLGWERRYTIIQGTAMGLLYLHEESPLRIIHRDLKASNILLDGDLNPKIADFGMARLLGNNETQGNTSRVVGTYGYMAPEYAIQGHFSTKSDVFSFGILVLEILSGRRCIQNGENVERLLDLTWKNWREGTVGNMLDPVLRNGTGSMHEMLRCIHIGLLCVQENANSRPTMASIVLMLRSSTITLPVPSEPAFFVANNLFDAEVSISQEYHSTYLKSRKASKAKDAIPESSSQNHMSDTELYPR